ncbi:hypothetical protein COOONC_20014, partial [Cooperia oncophora]
MSKKAKRHKHQAEPVSSEVLTVTGDAVVTRDIFYVIEDELRMWLNWQTGENVEAIIRLIKSFCDLLNHRWNTSMRKTMSWRYFRCLVKHGIPFHCIWLRKYRTIQFFSNEEFIEKYPPTRNLSLFFRDLSDLEYKMRSSIWAFHNISIGSTTTGKKALLAIWENTNITSLRYQLCLASRHLNYKAVVSSLANSEILRMASETIEKREDDHPQRTYNIQRLIYFDSPIAIWMALQATLSMKHDSSFNMGNRLVMLAAMQSMIYTTNSVKNRILMQLWEFLIATILCGNPDQVSAVVALGNSVDRYHKSYEASSYFLL